MNRVGMGDNFVLKVLLLLFFSLKSPFVFVHTPTTIRLFVWLALFSVLFLKSINIKGAFGLILPILAIPILDFFLNINTYNTTESILKWVLSPIQMMTYLFLSLYIISLKHISLAKYVLVVYGMVILINGLTSGIASYVVPGIMRINVGDIIEDDQAMMNLKMNLNVIDYDGVYELVVLLPLLIMLYKWRNLFKNRGRAAFVSIFLIVFVLWVITMSKFTIALIVSVVLLALVLIRKKSSPKLIRKRLCASIICGCILVFIAPTVLNMVSGVIKDESVSSRIEGLALQMGGKSEVIEEGTDNYARQQAYMMSIDSIIKYPLIGGWKEEVSGGHSFILDTVAKYGLIGLLLIIIYYSTIFRRFILCYKQYPWIHYYYFGFATIVILCFVNPGSFYPQLLFAYPISALIFSQKTTIA